MVGPRLRCPGMTEIGYSISYLAWIDNGTFQWGDLMIAMEIPCDFGAPDFNKLHFV